MRQVHDTLDSCLSALEMQIQNNLATLEKHNKKYVQTGSVLPEYLNLLQTTIETITLINHYETHDKPMRQAVQKNLLAQQIYLESEKKNKTLDTTAFCVSATSASSSVSIPAPIQTAAASPVKKPPLNIEATQNALTSQLDLVRNDPAALIKLLHEQEKQFMESSNNTDMFYYLSARNRIFNLINACWRLSLLTKNFKACDELASYAPKPDEALLKAIIGSKNKEAFKYLIKKLSIRPDNILIDQKPLLSYMLNLYESHLKDLKMAEADQALSQIIAFLEVTFECSANPLLFTRDYSLVISDFFLALNDRYENKSTTLMMYWYAATSVMMHYMTPQDVNRFGHFFQLTTGKQAGMILLTMQHTVYFGCDHNYHKVLAILLQYNEIKNKQVGFFTTFNHWSPLELAIIRNHEKIVELLLNAGADPHYFNPHDFTTSDKDRRDFRF